MDRMPELYAEGLIFRLQAERFFINHRGLDYAIVALQTTATNGAPLSQFKYLHQVVRSPDTRLGNKERA